MSGDSGHVKKATERGGTHELGMTKKEEDLSRHEETGRERGALTSWRRSRKISIRTEKERDHARGTYFL